MTKEKQIDLIRQKCIEANPVIETHYCGLCEQICDAAVCYADDEGNPQPHQPSHTIERPIRLADVLLALPEAPGLSLWPDDTLCMADVEKRVFWNLRKDDLTEQSQECITFLAGLLQ